MKANELMIGDWVCLDGDTETPAEVVELRTDEILIQMKGDTACDIWGYADISPIPITAEILAENGWVRLSDAFGWNEEGFEEWHAVIDDCYTNYAVVFFIDGDYRIPSITSVHTLQHALRLCGLTDIADNFKI